MFIVSIIKYVSVNEEHADDLAFFYSFATSRDKTNRGKTIQPIKSKRFILLGTQLCSANIEEPRSGAKVKVGKAFIQKKREKL